MTEEEKNIMMQKMTTALPVMRKSLHISQGELSEMTGLGRSTISALETGKLEMTWSTFVPLLTIFRVNPESRKLFEPYEINIEQLNDFWIIQNRNSKKKMMREVDKDE